LAKGKYLLFLNSDCFVTKTAIHSCLKKIDQNPIVGVVGAKVLNLDQTTQEAGSLILKDGQPHFYGWFRSPHSGEVSFDRYVDWVAGCFLITSLEIFKSLNGFDEEFLPAYFEDTDFCFRVNKLGKRVMYNSEATVFHFRLLLERRESGHGSCPSTHKQVRP
jgi:GT2 family glycosyltransferase